MNKVASFLTYLLQAKGRHGLHSPLLYQLVDEGLKAELPEKLREIQNLKKNLSKDTRTFQNTFGTNSGAFKGSGTLGKFAKNASIPHKYGALLYRLVNHFQPKLVVEMGTCLGISSSYMATAGFSVLSCEGNSQLAALATGHHASLGLSNVEVVCKSFDDFILQEINQLPSIPFLYLDGDHSYDATLKYFNAIIKKADEHSVWVFDDIYWSSGMQKAWNEIKLHPAVSFSLDFFKCGVLLFKPMKEKQHFKIWY